MHKNIQLIALDLDGTLYNGQSQISERNKEAIRSAIASGVTVIISTGRPYVGLPLQDMEELGIRYAITANGAAVYRIPEKELLFDDCMTPSVSIPLLHELYQLTLHLDAFINGDGYTQNSTSELISKLNVPDSLRKYIATSRKNIPSLPDYIMEHNLPVAKMTINFIPDGNGGFIDRDKAEAILKAHTELSYVSGGFSNLECTKAGISKSKGLSFLCDYLNIPCSATMACGDSENDLDIINAAAVGVAMSNAQQMILDAADFISKSNEEDGVAYAIETLLGL